MMEKQLLKAKIGAKVMESIPVSRKRLRNRRRRRQLKKNKRFDRDRLKFEVRFKERQKIISGSGVYVSKNKIGKSMDANAFWENYTVAQQWQQTHNVAWWKSRCLAFEEENKILRNTVSKLSQLKQCQCPRTEQINEILLSAFQNEIPQQSQERDHMEFQNEVQNKSRYRDQKNTREDEEENLEYENHSLSDDESLEFQINDGMMEFLKQSIQHKLELKHQREEEEALEVEAGFPQIRATQMKERTENAKLLYGEASPRILGMETALQATIDSHKEKVRPHFWPNIPLKL